MAKHLAREGAYVVILGRNEQKGSALVGEIKAEGGEALFLVSNVLDKALLEQNKQEILKAYGKIDVLVNLAGGNQAGATIPPDKTIFDLDIDAFRTVGGPELIRDRTADNGLRRGHGGARERKHY